LHKTKSANKNELEVFMKYRIGVDLGTTSIGIAAYSLDEQEQINDLIHLDSYIFSESVDPQKNETLNTARRAARLVRRQMQRNSARYRKINYIAQSLGITKNDLDKVSPQDIHRLRAKAPSEKLTLAQLIKVYCHIVKNRGYKGHLSRADKGVGEKISDTKKMLDGYETLGQLLYAEKEQSEGLAWRKLNEAGTFIDREFVENEFKLIWEQQIKHHPQLEGAYQINETFKDMFPDHSGKNEISLKDAFYSAMFYQRPIKWALDSVGKCSLEQTEFRAAIAQPEYQKYRLAAIISNLRVKNSKDKSSRQLTCEEIKKVYDFVQSGFEKYDKERGKIAYSLIYKELGFSEDERFVNDRSEGADGIKGISTLKTFYELDKESFRFINAFNALNLKSQELVLEFLSNITNFSDIEDNPETYIDAKFDEMTANIADKKDDEKIAAVKFIMLLRKEECFSNKNFQLEKGRASYSLTALKKITGHLLKGKNEREIIDELYPSLADEYTGSLREIEKVETNNPVIDKALREFKRTLDFVIKKFGQNPSEITIELSRELKNSLARRGFIEEQNAIRQKDRSSAIAQLREYNITLTSENIEKHLLWKEQLNKCPYCGKNIPIKDFVGNEVQVDHIISRSQGGPNIYSNKVLCCRKCNQDKGGRTPYEFKFEQDIKSYRKRKKKGEMTDEEKRSPLINFINTLWGVYYKEQKFFNGKKAVGEKGKKARDKINFLLANPIQAKEMVEEFSGRHLNNLSWINKIVLDWCKDICQRVDPSFGVLTAYLRSKWHFDDILPLIRIEEKKPLFNEDGKEIDHEKWMEIFEKKDLSFHKAVALEEDFKQYINGLPEKDKPINDTDRQEHFKKFRKDLRRENKFYKRWDHRHHAVDAAIIGLCSLSLIQRAQKHNKKYGGLYEQKNDKGEIEIPGFDFEKDMPELYSKIKDDVCKYLKGYIVWHKPDRFPSGKFFDETAYNIVDDKEDPSIKRFAIRQTLEKILGKEQDREKFIDKLNEVVVGERMKLSVVEQLRKRLRDGLSLKDAFLGKDGDYKDGLYFNGNKIKAIKVLYKERGLMKLNEMDGTINTIRNGRPRNKYYQNAGYACMDFDEKTFERIDTLSIWKYHKEYADKPLPKEIKKKYEGKSIPPEIASKFKGKSVPKGIIRIFAGDIVYETKEKEFYLVKSFHKEFLDCIPVNSAYKKSIKTIRNFKSCLLCKTRADIAKIKKEHGK
jgi:CRISPR-associated endonuclease Csn1